MSRRTQSLPPNFVEKQRRSRCTAAICFSWKVFTCVLSHVTLVSLVVAYCIGGALLFQHLEQENEMEVKRAAKHVRENVTDALWLLTEAQDVFHEDNWTLKAEENLKVFEEQILTLMKTRGWDGEDGDTHTQWTFFGALFYSIIVITTIGYGHIAPRTSWGKVTTIFYAILGIPLMLLCLSNIGDVLATSFRFLYWRICCFVCTREPKKSRRHRSGRSSFRQSHRFSSRSQPPPVIRRSIRASQRSADSGFVTAYEHGMIHAYSDPELHFNAFEAEKQYRRERDFYKEYEMDEKDRNFNNRSSRFSSRAKNRERFRDRNTVDRERYSRRRSADIIDELEVPAKRTASSRSVRTASVSRDLNRVRSQTLPVRPQPKSSKMRSKSVDPRTTQYDDLISEADCKAPIYCNKYAIDDLDRRESSGNHRRGSVPKSHGPAATRQQFPAQPHHPHPHHPQSRYGNRLELPGFDVPRMSRFDDYDDDDDDEYDDTFEIPVRGRRAYAPPARRERVPPPPSPRIMSPMGFAVHRQARLTIPDDDSMYDDDGDYGELSPGNRPVPIWLCVFLVISYIIAGAFLFSEWEKWTFLDSAYFCFITLTTIGFGDFVPAQGVKDNSKESIALCSLYLLFGISLLAMSFNLVQEEVIANVKDVARRLGILKEEEIDE